MIHVKNQYILLFGIGATKDIVNEQDLISFLVTDAAGGELPAFQISFKTRDASLRKKINQQESINISIGRDYKEVQPIQMMLYSSAVTPLGNGQWVVSLSGMLNLPKFLNDAKIAAHKGTGRDTIAKIASASFSVDNTCAPSSDNQTWIQANIPDRKFIKEVWQHTHIANSFPLVAISLDKVFILKDITTLAKSNPRYDLTKDVSLNGDSSESSNFGFINNWAGFSRKVGTHTLETGVDAFITESVKTRIVHSLVMEKHPTPGVNSLSGTLLSDNVHPAYQRASLHNTMGLTTFSGVVLTVSFSDMYLPIRPLDLVYYSEKTGSKNLSVEAVSGNYIVSRTGRSIENRKFVTVLELVRESRNTI